LPTFYEIMTTSPATSRSLYSFPCTFERDRYSPIYLSRQVTEEHVQLAIIQTLELYRVDVIAIDAGMRRARGRVLSSAKRFGVSAGAALAAFKAGGLPAGFPDLHATLAPDGVSFYCEVKAPAWIDPATKKIIREAGRPSSEQLDYLDSKQQRGAIVCVAWSVDDVIRILGDRMSLNCQALRPPR